MDNHTPYLWSLSREWERLAQATVVEEVRKVCQHHRRQAMEDLMAWRDLHHAHILSGLKDHPPTTQ